MATDEASSTSSQQLQALNPIKPEDQVMEHPAMTSLREAIHWCIRKTRILDYDDGMANAILRLPDHGPTP